MLTTSDGSMVPSFLFLFLIFFLFALFGFSIGYTVSKRNTYRDICSTGFFVYNNEYYVIKNAVYNYTDKQVEEFGPVPSDTTDWMHYGPLPE